MTDESPRECSGAVNPHFPSRGPQTERLSAPGDAWQCSARKQALPEPADCNWPFCGCDPYASKVMTAIEEAGFSLDCKCLATPHPDAPANPELPTDGSSPALSGSRPAPSPDIGEGSGARDAETEAGITQIVRACAWSTLIGWRDELGENIDFICDQIARKVALAGEPQASVMQDNARLRAALEATNYFLEPLIRFWPTVNIAAEIERNKSALDGTSPAPPQQGSGIPSSVQDAIEGHYGNVKE
jgi:hypothetical protein